MININCGLYQFNKLPFGVNVAPAIFQLIDTLLGELDFAGTYLDGILISSKAMDEHVRHLPKVLGHLKKNVGLKLVKTCELFIKYLL